MTDVARESVYSFIESNANQSSINHVTQPTSEPASLTSTVDLLTELSLLPDASKKRLIKRSRKTQKSEILTSFSYNNDSVAKKAKEKTLKTKKKKIFSHQNRSKTTECIICGETFEEDWIQCHKCKGFQR